MKISGDWLDARPTQEVLAMLAAGGHQALLVGGCVRNALLGVKVADLDISTDAPPDRVWKLADAAGMKTIPTGIEHGTVTVICRDVPFEITTFRRDVSTDGRRATVQFSDQIEEDAARRDLTMNALYAQADGTVVDPLGGGIQDTLTRHVRFVGEASARIREDYLRILRFFRFHALYGDPAQGIDPEGLAASAANSAGIETLSRERIGAEMRKLLAAADPAPAMAAMAQAGCLAPVLPGADVRLLPVLIHLEAGRPPRWLRRLALIGGEDAQKSLCLSRAEARDLAALRVALGGTFSPAALGWQLGATLAEDAILAKSAMFETNLPPDWQAAIARGARADFPVSAADLMPGLTGAALGAALKRLQGLWLAADLRPDRAELLSQI